MKRISNQITVITILPKFLACTGLIGLLVLLGGCGGGNGSGGTGGGGGGGGGCPGCPTVITMDNNNRSGANTGTVFSFDQTSGQLTQEKVLKTGGTGAGGGAVQVAVAATQRCIFLIDYWSIDIAAFTGSSGGYAKVGNYSNPNAGLGWGGALAVSKDGMALYSVNDGSLNLSQWTINSDCSLAHVQDYVPLGSNGWGGIVAAVSPNGNFLLYSGNGYIESFGINADHSLTDNGPNYFNTFPQCAIDGCSPQLIAFTGDGSAIAVGNCCSSGQQFMFVANTSSTGVISNQAVIFLTSQPQLYAPETPVFDSACLNQQKCYLYVGMAGYGDKPHPGGVTVVAFDKDNISGATVISAQQNAASFGMIGQMGNWILQASFPDTLTAFPINYSTGTLGNGVATKDPQGVGLTSFVAF